MSRNSPVQDEMSVNSAIKACSKLPAIRVAKHENRAGGAKPPLGAVEKENNTIHT